MQLNKKISDAKDANQTDIWKVLVLCKDEKTQGQPDDDRFL